jgi:hypothetical protein
MKSKKNKVVELEQTRNEILKKIAQKTKSNSKNFSASHASHTSGSKHNSVTH